MSQSLSNYFSAHRKDITLRGSKRFKGKTGEYYMKSKDGKGSLTPIPFSNKKLSVKDYYEYLKAEKIAISIRRIEYGKKLSQKKTILISPIMTKKIIFIQRWWRTIFCVILLQKNIKGWLIRLILRKKRRKKLKIYNFFFHKWKLVSIDNKKELSNILQLLLSSKYFKIKKGILKLRDYTLKKGLYDFKKIAESIINRQIQEVKIKKEKLGSYLTISYYLNKWFNVTKLKKQISRGLTLIILKSILISKQGTFNNSNILYTNKQKYTIESKNSNNNIPIDLLDKQNKYISNKNTLFNYQKQQIKSSIFINTKQNSIEKYKSVNSNSCNKFDKNRKKFTIKRRQKSSSLIGNENDSISCSNLKNIQQNVKEFNVENNISQTVNGNDKQTNYECNNIIDALGINDYFSQFSLFCLPHNNQNKIQKNFTFSKFQYDNISFYYNKWKNIIQRRLILQRLKEFKNTFFFIKGDNGNKKGIFHNVLLKTYFYKWKQYQNKNVLLLNSLITGKTNESVGAYIILRKPHCIKYKMIKTLFNKWKNITNNINISSISNSKITSKSIIIQGIINNMQLGKRINTFHQIIKNNKIKEKINKNVSQSEKNIFLVKIISKKEENSSLTKVQFFYIWKSCLGFNNINYLRTKKVKNMKKDIQLKFYLQKYIIHKNIQLSNFYQNSLIKKWYKWIKNVSSNMHYILLKNINVSKGDLFTTKQYFDSFHSIVFTPIIIKKIICLIQQKNQKKKILNKLMKKKDMMLIKEKYFNILRSLSMSHHFVLKQLSKSFIAYSKLKNKTKLLLNLFFMKTKKIYLQKIKLKNYFSKVSQKPLHKMFLIWKKIIFQPAKAITYIPKLLLIKKGESAGFSLNERDIKNGPKTLRSSYIPKRHISESLDVNSSQTVREHLHQSINIKSNNDITIKLKKRKNPSITMDLSKREIFQKIEEEPVETISISDNSKYNQLIINTHIKAIKHMYSISKWIDKNKQKILLFKIKSTGIQYKRLKDICYLLKVTFLIKNANNSNFISSIIKNWNNYLFLSQVEEKTYLLIQKVYNKKKNRN